MDSCIEDGKTCIIANGYALSQLSLTCCQNRQYYTLCLLADGICRLFFFQNLQNRLLLLGAKSYHFVKIRHETEVAIDFSSIL